MMEEPFFSSVKTGFKNYISSPLPFLEGSSDISENFRNQCKTVYDFCKASQGLSKPDPLPKLLIEGFDDEQIWGQIELFNKKEAAVCLKATDILISSQEDITFDEPVEEDVPTDEDEEMKEEKDSEEEDLVNFKNEDEESGSEDGFHFEESDDNDFGEDAEEDDQEEGFREANRERTEVDDDFFSLRKMEKFLEDEDKKFEMELRKPPEGDIDYFEDVLSSDDADSLEGDDEEHTTSSHRSSRHLKYSDFYDDPLQTDAAVEKRGSTGPVSTELEKVDEIPTEKQSAFQKHQQQILKKIGVLEDRALAPADWQMKGEVKGSSRPENSLLQEALQFDNVARPPAEITEEHTKDLQDVIKQRILDGAWDDVERKYKPQGDAAEYKKRIVLDSSQSKLTLSEIYEKEYLEKSQKSGKREDEKESEEHATIKKDMESLFRKLDALSNFNFIAPPPEPEIKLISNVPSIAKEEVQPITHAESQVLAPEEVFAKSTGGEEKASQEKSSTDKKRERRKKKLRMKGRAKARLEKLKKLNPESDKVKSLEAIDQLKRAAKAPGSNTTIVQGKTKSDSKLTSQRFFSKLQEKGFSSDNRKKKSS